MMHATEWQMAKTQAVAANGMVSSKHPLASQAGIEMLKRGGNAIDAAVATAFAVGVVEPWMNGLGGGGFLSIYLARTGQSFTVDFGMVAPEAAHPGMYVLEDGILDGLFPWRKTRDNEALYGYKAISVPGTVAGLALALRTFGSLDLATVLQPAIRYAEEGFPIEWFATLQITLDAEILAKFPAAAGIFFKNGFPRKPADPPKVELLRQPALALTLQRIAQHGPEEFYQGETARTIAREIQAHGGILSEADLARYAPILSEGSLESAYRDCRILTVPGLSGGPTLIQALDLLSGFDLGAYGPDSAAALHLLAEASRIAFADRYHGMGASEAATPWRTLLEPGRIERLRTGIALDRAAAAARPAALRPGGSTTHLSVIDRERNMVSLTQTLVSRFGSRVMIPEVGVLLNNGMFWFDPEPGKANSIVGGRRPLSNMTPLLILKNGQPWISLGASGGRRIIGAMIHMTSLLVDHGLDIQEAICAPRIDLSTGNLVADARLSDRTLARLKAMGHTVLPVEESIAPRSFSGPCGVMIDHESGTLRSGVDPFHPAAAIGY